jgi:hypothetical protein
MYGIIMKNKTLLGITILTIILSFTALTCNSGGTSDVTIVINLGLENNALYNVPRSSSIIDRVLRLFATKAEAAQPSYIESLTLNITADDLDTITKKYNYPSIPDTITLKVPAGESRTFEVLADTGSVIFRGIATRNLGGGSIMTIPITMELHETKIIIPDYLNNRIVQIDDISGENWKVLTSVAGITTFSPYDIDFDSQGRIYIANYSTGATNGVIIRIDSINRLNPSTYGSSAVSAISYAAIAIDRNNSIIYSARNNNTLWRATLGSTTFIQITLSGITFTGSPGIRGLAVDESGYLYIAASITTSPFQVVIKYNPTLNTFTYYSNNLVTPWDVLVKGSYLYVTNVNGSGTNSQIIRLTTDLTSPIGFGQNIDVLGTSTGDFYGPRRFVAILNRKITIIDDEDMYTANLDKLISMDDIYGTSWQTYGSQGSGAGQFNFYYYC